jgi:hypothetical protein
MHQWPDHATLNRGDPRSRRGRVRVRIQWVLSRQTRVGTVSAIMGDQAPAGPNGRSVDGKFAPGNKHSLGHAGNRRQRELRTALVEAATPEKVKAVEESLHELAAGGDVAAAKVWLDHVVGKPVQAVELSGPDGQALDLTCIVSTIMFALGDDPEARVKVAAAFRRLAAVEKASDGRRLDDRAVEGD